MRASPVRIIIIYSLQCTLVLRKGQPVAPACPRTIRAVGAAAPAAPMAPAPLGILKCQGRIQGEHPIYLPANCLFSRKIVRRIHVETLHGGVALTMAAVCETYWIPTLRQIVKSIKLECWGCKRFRALPLTKPPPGQLPTNRTEGGTPFEVIGTDFAGPIRYKQVYPGKDGNVCAVQLKTGNGHLERPV